MPAPPSHHVRCLRFALSCALLFTCLHAWSAPASSVALAGAASGAAAEDRDLKMQLARKREEQQRLLTEIRTKLASMPPWSAERTLKERLLAEIEKRVADEGTGFPRSRYMTSVTQDATFGPYCLEMRRRIENQGNHHFPQANGHKLYGRVTFNLRIDASGRLIETELVRGSGSELLDRSARQIAQASAPFRAFTPAMRAQVDEIVYTAAFNFMHEADAAASPASTSDTH